MSEISTENKSKGSNNSDTEYNELTTYFIPKNNFNDLKKWTYNGICNSIIYKYVTSDIAEFVVKFIPTGVAPNIITMIAFFFSTLGLIISFYDCGFNNERFASSFTCFSAAFCYFAYQTLDNADGKLARKLKASSALGFFFDHNLDAFSTATITITATNILGSTSTIENNLIYITTTIAFFMTTWEEYVTGVMNLPMFSGVDEGAYITISIFLVSGFYGSDIWTKTNILGFQLKDFFIFTLLILSSVFIVVK